MNPDAIAFLKKCEPRFTVHIERIGDIGLPKRRSNDPFLALIESIAYQQLAAAAARVIWSRVLALFPEQTPSAHALLDLSEDQLRSAGLSRSKARSLREIAAKKAEGVVPTARSIARMTEHNIFERLIQIRGVGPWTVDMLLIFSLRRPDIMPSTDYGVRKGIQLLYRKRSLPSPKQVAKLTECWSPHRTTAALYLWRIAAAAKPKKRKAATS